MQALFVFITNVLSVFIPDDPAEAQAFIDATGVDWSWVPAFADPAGLAAFGVSFISYSLFCFKALTIFLLGFKPRSAPH
jgi:hypothetical protein